MGRGKPQEGLKVEYFGRASAEGKVGTSLWLPALALPRIHGF